eukprot:11349245-Alexandrium_andersonii.AAC.1
MGAYRKDKTDLFQLWLSNDMDMSRCELAVKRRITHSQDWRFQKSTEANRCDIVRADCPEHARGSRQNR